MSRQPDRTLDYSAPSPAKHSPWRSVAIVFSILGWLASLLLMDGAEAFASVLLLVATLAALRTFWRPRGKTDQILALVLLAIDIFAIGALLPSVIHWFRIGIP